MALGSKSSKKFFVTSGGGSDEINAARKAIIDGAFDADLAKGNVQLIDDQTFGPLIFNIQRMQDDLDEVRRFIVANEPKVGSTFDATTDFTVGTTVVTDDSIVMTPSTSDTVTINAEANGVLKLTTVDAAGTDANILIAADGDITLTVADTSHYVDTNGLIRGGNVGYYADTYIPVMPVEFAIGDNYRSPGSLMLNGHAMAPSDNRATYIAQKIIPKGYKASACIVNGVDADGDARFTCFQGDISGTTPSAVSSSTATNSTATFSSNIVGDGEKYCTIVFDPGDNTDLIYGAKITIAKI